MLGGSDSDRDGIAFPPEKGENEEVLVM